jgi:hypothetical protein
MNLPQKTILSLIISVILFAAFSLLAFTGLFDLVETRFYSPQIVKSLDREVEEIAHSISTLIGDLRGRFADTLEDEALQRSFLPDPAAEDTFERSRIYGLLMNSLPGLRTVRFVDDGGSGIHFSTLADDVLVQTGSSLAYRSYRDCPGVLPYRDVETAEGQPPRIVFDSSGEQLVFSYPFADFSGTYRGSALFGFSVRAVAEYLIRRGQIKVGEDIALVDSPDGFLLGLPASETGNLKREAAAAWREDIFTLFIPEHAEVEPLALVSAKSETGFFAGRLVQEQVLVLPPVMRFTLLAAFFLTTFLAIFLFFNLRQDSVTVIRSRLKQLQVSLMRQYYETKGDMDWKRWGRELEQRREDIRLEIKRGLPQGKGIDALIDRLWDEMIAFPPAGFGAAGKPAIPPDSAEQEELEELALAEDPAEGLPIAESAGGPEEADVRDDMDAGDAGETIVTPDAFDDGRETAAELEPLETEEALEPPETEEDPEPLETEADLAALASRIEFGPGPSADSGVLFIPDAASGGHAVELSSPFESLSFESPDFSGFDPAESKREAEAGKKQEAGESEGLEEIGGDGGLPLVYRPFQFRENSRPVVLRPLAGPEEGPVHEQDGLHLINRDILDPTLETTRGLDPKFLRLVESIIGHEPK